MLLYYSVFAFRFVFSIVWLFLLNMHVHFLLLLLVLSIVWSVKKIHVAIVHKRGASLMTNRYRVAPKM